MTPQGKLRWAHWVDTFLWDRNGRHNRLHPKLTQEHFVLTTTSKMRNPLAEHVLSYEMLYLAKARRKEMLENGTFIKQVFKDSHKFQIRYV